MENEKANNKNNLEESLKENLEEKEELLEEQPPVMDQQPEAAVEPDTDDRQDGPDADNRQEIQPETELSELEKARLQWREEKEALEDSLLRARADFENFKRRSRIEQDEAREYALFDFTGRLLAVLDNLERALESARSEGVPEAHVTGLEMIYKQLIQLLEQEGITQIEALGRPFDPYYHEAVMQTAEGEGEPNTVVDEMQKGYMFKKRVLRPAMVKVLKSD